MVLYQKKKNFDFIWFNQWEPSRTKQYAYDCYVNNFKPDYLETHNLNIHNVSSLLIPDHSLLVGGFPCQDYSVARTISNEKGIEGVKGVLWWQIHRILEEKKNSFFLVREC